MVEPSSIDEREVGEAPGVEERRRDVGPPAVVQRDAAEQRHRRLDPGLAARRPLRRAGGAGGQDHGAPVLARRRQVGAVVGLDQRLQRPYAVDLAVDDLGVGPGRAAAPLPRCRRPGRRTPRRRPAPWATSRPSTSASCGAGEGGVEVERVGAQLGGGDAGVDEATVVAAHDRDAVALAHPELAQRVGQGVGAGMHLAEGQRPELVDETEAVGRPHGQRGEPAGRSGTPGQQRLARAAPASTGSTGGSRRRPRAPSGRSRRRSRRSSAW